MRSRASGDDGLAIIFTALLLLVLLTFAAFAVDLGGVYSARRNDQNAADTASLGATQSFSLNDSGLASVVKDLAHGTLGVTLSDAQWNSCSGITDPDNVDTALSGANCITVNVGRSRIQVRIPTRDHPSVFGGAIGISGYAHNAFAIAGLVRSGFGAVLPFGLGAGAGGGDGQVCVKTGPGGHSEPPCDGPSSGNFGYLDFAYFGSADLNTTLDCGSGGQRPRNENNAAVGVDHDLSTYGGSPHGAVDVVDTNSPCGGTARPNAAYTLTGNTPQNFGNAIYSGSGYSDGLGGRLQRSGTGVFSGAGDSTNVGGHILDDNPLWEFLPTSFPPGSNVPNSCAKSIFTQVLANNYSSLPTAPADVQSYVQNLPTKAEQMRALIGRCISHYNGVTWDANGAITPVGDPPSGCTGACSDPIFTRNSSTTDAPDLYDIQYTARFGYVPELNAAFPNGNSITRFAGFRPIFFQRLLGGSCSGGSCTHDFEPGLGYTNTSAENKADGITAFVLPRNSLPNGLGADTAPFDVNKNRFVQLIR
ncbi:MAG: Tad domain-containing protein [Microthrixaceae bacterium]